MKNLLKICVRYMLTAVLLVVLVLAADLLFAAVSLVKVSETSSMEGMYTKEMEDIEQEFSLTGGNYAISGEGLRILEDSSCQWAMRLDEAGDVVWEYQLPPEIPRHFSIGDVASFCRWYLKDYPIFTWHGETGLMVYGVSKEIARFDFWSNMKIIARIPEILLTLLLLDILFVAILAVFFGIRFYRALKPIGNGIEHLAQKQEVRLKEQGPAKDLIRQLNEAAALLLDQDQRLKKRDQARTDWISGVSHDVRTPLSLIMGLSDELSRESSLDESARRKAAAIRQSSESIGRLIADLNLTVNLEYGSSPLRTETLCPASLLRECIAGLYNQGGFDERFQILPIISGEAQTLCLPADRQLLMRVFQNVIGNSIRHNPQGAQASVRLFVESGQLVFFFSDSGEGIPPAVAEILEGTQEPRPGIHIMGLRVVCQIIRAHGGEVRFVRRNSGYADVEITLPLA